MGDPLWMRLLRRSAEMCGWAVGALLLAWQWNTTPAGDNPWRALSLDHPIGHYTPVKLAEALPDPAWCRSLLKNSSLVVADIEDRREGEFCAFENAVSLERSATRYSAPVQASCPLAATLFLWERDVVQPLARETFGAGVARIEHVGAYNCRRVYGGAKGRPSEHATANAIDVIGFRLEDGRVVSVAKHWEKAGAPEGRFLRALHARSCALFRGVLGPDYNAQHEDHFHLDMGPYALCE